ARRTLAHRQRGVSRGPAAGPAGLRLLHVHKFLASIPAPPIQRPRDAGPAAGHYPQPALSRQARPRDPAEHRGGSIHGVRTGVSGYLGGCGRPRPGAITIQTSGFSINMLVRRREETMAGATALLITPERLPEPTAVVMGLARRDLTVAWAR